MLMRPNHEQSPSTDISPDTGDEVALYRARIETAQRNWKRKMEILNARHAAVCRQIDMVLVAADPAVVAAFAQSAPRPRPTPKVEVRSYLDENGELDVAAYRKAIAEQQARNRERIRSVLQYNKDVMQRIDKIERDGKRADLAA